MPHTLCRGAWTDSGFKPLSVTHRVQLRAITWLLILGTALLLGWARNSSVVIDAEPPEG